MEKLSSMSQRLGRIDLLKLIQSAFSTSKIQAKAKQLNEKQLDEGKGAKGQQLRTYKSIYPNVYAAFTINEKKKKGQPIDRVTLKDTGDFRRNLKVVPFPDNAIIKGDTKKPDGNMEENVDISAALGVSEVNRSELVSLVAESVLTGIKNALIV